MSTNTQNPAGRGTARLLRHPKPLCTQGCGTSPRYPSPRGAAAPLSPPRGGCSGCWLPGAGRFCPEQTPSGLLRGCLVPKRDTKGRKISSRGSLQRDAGQMRGIWPGTTCRHLPPAAPAAGFTRSLPASRNTAQPRPAASLPAQNHPGCAPAPAGPARGEPFPFGASWRLRLQQHPREGAPKSPPCTAPVPLLQQAASDQPDFGGELHAGFDDQGPVGMHGHAGLPLHHERAAGDDKKHRQSSAPPQHPRCSPLNALPPVFPP